MLGPWLDRLDLDFRPGAITFIPEGVQVIMSERDPLLQEREKTHGSFKTNAEVSQRIKLIYRDNLCGVVKPEHCEALDMIALKLSRILSGQANHKDHWDDIAGYAKLATEACEEK